MTTIQDFFTEICKRGCLIETRSVYPIDHLPKCLVSVNDKFPCEYPYGEFKITSLISNSVTNIYFRSYLCINGYTVTTCGTHNSYYYSFFILPGNDFHKEIMNNLDLLTHQLYNNNFDLSYPSHDMLESYRKNIITKMISDFLDQNILLHLYVFYKFLLPFELKFIIIIKYIKINNWHNVGISVNDFLL